MAISPCALARKAVLEWGSQPVGERRDAVIHMSDAGEVADECGIHEVVANRSFTRSIIRTGLGSIPCRSAR